jgi:hypothetical protein
MNIEHGKRITTESFYEGKLSSSKQELEISLFTTREAILKDIIDALSLLSSSQTTKLDLCVQVDTQGRYRLIKKWMVI